MNPKGYRYSLDPFLVADFVRVPPKVQRVLDLGTGSGIILFLLREKAPGICLVGLEKQETLLLAAQAGKRERGAKRVYFVRGDIRHSSRLFPKACFDIVLANPPYRRKGSGRTNPDPEKASARHELEVDIGGILVNSAGILRDLGRLFLIFHPSRLQELLSGMEESSIHPERIRFVHGFMRREAKMVLVEGRKNGKGDLKVEPPLVVYERAGEYTEEMKRIYITIP
ncbi:MAG: methyltransferase domain-containing protein [Nitrospinae bacterium]|nr:methyltransferase domain-containing protein [Nitrospinota bacterium]